DGYRAGWTMIQRRFNGSVDFYRPWSDYVEGFGDLDGEFCSWPLTVFYDNFYIDGEAEDYRLHLGRFYTSEPTIVVCFVRDGVFSARIPLAQNTADSELAETVHNLTVSNDYLVSEMQRQAEVDATLTSSVDEIRKELKRQKKQDVTLEKLIDKIPTDNERLWKNISRLEETDQTLQSNYENVREELGEHKAVISKLTSNYNKIFASLPYACRQYSPLKVDMNKIKLENKELKDINCQLRIESNDLSYAKLLAELKTAETDEQSTNLSTQIRNLEEKLQICPISVVCFVRDGVLSARIQLPQYSADSELAETVHNLTVSNDYLVSEMQRQAEVDATLTSSVDEIRKELKRQKKQDVTLEKRIDKIPTDNERLWKNISRLEETDQTLQSKYENVREELGEHDTVISKLTSNYNKIFASLPYACRQYSRLKADIKKFKRENKELKDVNLQLTIESNSLDTAKLGAELRMGDTGEQSTKLSTQIRNLEEKLQICPISGLRNIHRLTTSGNFTLRIDFEDFEPCTVCRFWPLSIIYYEFYIGGEDEDYRLHLGFHYVTETMIDRDYSTSHTTCINDKVQAVRDIQTMANLQVVSVIPVAIADFRDRGYNTSHHAASTNYDIRALCDIQTMANVHLVFLIVITIAAALHFRVTYGFEWTLSSPPDGSTVYACLGEKASFRWQYSTSVEETVVYIEWQQTTDDGKTRLATYLEGLLSKFPSIKLTVAFLPNSGIEISNYTWADYGQYQVTVHYTHNGVLQSQSRSVILAPPDAPILDGGRLVASIQPEPVIDVTSGQRHLQLTCGTFLKEGGRSLSVLWT
ncbi:hypothetical protein BaRGS_00029654, partial [Batillaria attramentaria]